jgi:proline dehydrogenase
LKYFSALLLQLSEVIARTRNYFTEITGVQKMALGNITPEEFQQTLDQRFKIKTDNEEVQRWFQGMDYDQRGLMNIFSWNGLIDMQHLINDLFKVPNLTTGRIERIITALTREEEEMFRNMMRRIHQIAKTARDKDVRVLIDAEQTYFQPAINRITMELMRKYNKEKAIIFNTYQCYLKVRFISNSMYLVNSFFGLSPN